MFKVTINETTETFTGIDAFRHSCRTATRAAKDTTTGFAKNDVKWYDGEELITHTKIGDRVKGEI